MNLGKLGFVPKISAVQSHGHADIFWVLSTQTAFEYVMVTYSMLTYTLTVSNGQNQTQNFGPSEDLAEIFESVLFETGISEWPAVVLLAEKLGEVNPPDMGI